VRVIVVGAGIAGLAAAHRLRAGGAAVTVLSADPPGGVQSAGRSRIFRLAHDSAELTDAAGRAAAGWQAWEVDARRTLLDRTGLLLTGDVSHREVHLRTHGVYAAATGAAHPLAAALPHWTRDLAGAAIRAADTIGYLAAGLNVRRGTAGRVAADGVTLTDGRLMGADRVVVCAGADTYRLMALPEPPRSRHARFSFEVRRPGAPAPCWIQRDPGLSEPFYAVADGPSRYAVGLSEGADVELPEDEVVADMRRRVCAIVAELLPGVVPQVVDTIVCEAPANAAGHHDGWDMPEADGVLAVTGPNLFKFGPLLGDLAAATLTGAPTAPARTVADSGRGR
jgi:sarcosine oxidase